MVLTPNWPFSASINRKVLVEDATVTRAFKVSTINKSFAEPSWMAIAEVEAGKPVTIVYLDVTSNGIGTLFIPNTLAAIKGSPNPEEADLLIDYLLSPEIEARLAAGPSAQIPLNRENKAAIRVKGPTDVVPMRVDFEKAAKHWKAAQRFIHNHFLK